VDKEKRGFLERGAALYEKLNYALGAIALGASLVAPAELVKPLQIFGALQIIEGAAIRLFLNRRSKKAKLAPA